MVTSLSELKDLIIWAKAQKVQSLKVGEVEFTLSNYALIEDLIGLTSQTSTVSQKTEEVVPPIPDPTKPPQDDPDLFWSSIP